jgi:[citrate (pro-3S)-lyase] ligase
MFDGLKIEVIEKDTHGVEQVSSFLQANNLLFEEDIDVSILVKDGKDIVATGSLAGNVIKCVANSQEYRNQNLTSKVISKLLSIANEKNIFHVFLFTSPTQKDFFTNLGFSLVAEYALFALLEIGPNNLNDYLEKILKSKRAGKNISAAVLNCNPFTKGHQYLIETAAKMSDVLYVFVVEEDRSVFPFKHRFELVKKGTEHLKNVVVLSGDQYMVSSKTFPTYFLKDQNPGEIVRSQAGLDVTIFAEKIAPALEIKKRFVGTEPGCKTTGNYNDAMSEVLPNHGIELEVIERKVISGDNFISASKVRQLITDGKLEKTKDYVPKTTFEYLNSMKAKPIIDKLKSN